jgi:hypothetical protein
MSMARPEHGEECRDHERPRGHEASGSSGVRLPARTARGAAGHAIHGMRTRTGVSRGSLLTTASPPAAVHSLPAQAASARSVVDVGAVLPAPHLVERGGAYCFRRWPMEELRKNGAAAGSSGTESAEDFLKI